MRKRQGHTEAAVDFCQMAGLEPVGVIAELVEEGGVGAEGGVESWKGEGMMKRDECLAFGKKWGIKVVTIEGMIEHLNGEGRD